MIFIFKYKKDFEDSFTSVRVCKSLSSDVRFPEISKGVRDIIGLTSEKLVDIQKMMKFMTDSKDIDFFRSLTKVKANKSNEPKSQMKDIKAMLEPKIISMNATSSSAENKMKSIEPENG